MYIPSIPFSEGDRVTNTKPLVKYYSNQFGTNVEGVFTTGHDFTITDIKVYSEERKTVSLVDDDGITLTDIDPESLIAVSQVVLSNRLLPLPDGQVLDLAAIKSVGTLDSEGDYPVGIFDEACSFYIHEPSSGLESTRTAFSRNKLLLLWSAYLNSLK